MFKNYLLKSVFVFLFLFTFANHSFAYTLPTNNCTATSTTYGVSIVSIYDLNGSIPLCVNATANLPVRIYEGTVSTSNEIYTVTVPGQATFSYPKWFLATNIGGINHFQFIAADNTGVQGKADITINLNYTPITLTASPSISQGATIAPNTAESFTCTNSTEMYYDGTLVASDYNGSASSYNLVYPTTPTLGSHSVACHNVAADIQGLSPAVGSQYYPLLNFNVGGNMSGNISAPNCTIPNGTSSCSTTVSWNTYNPVATSAVTSETSGSGASSPNNIIGNTNDGSQNVNIPYIVLGSHQGRNFYLYNNAISLAQATAIAQCASGSSWDGSKCTNSPINQNNPNDPNNPNNPNDPNNPASCTLPNYWIVSAAGGTCAQCPSGTAYNTANQSCDALPYTHFLSFNVSAGYVAKGAGIDINWSIQKPDSSCKIIGVAIKTGAQVFISADNSSVNNSVTGGSSNPTLSAGSLKAMTGSYFTVNQSTRFTASCITPVGSYNPGYHQLVRDIYLTGDSER